MAHDLLGHRGWITAQLPPEAPVVGLGQPGLVHVDDVAPLAVDGEHRLSVEEAQHAVPLRVARQRYTLETPVAQLIALLHGGGHSVKRNLDTAAGHDSLLNLLGRPDPLA